MGFQSVVSKPPAAPMPVKFSHDIARLQHILSIRKAPLGAQIKFVIDLLRETRLSYTMEQINQARYVDFFYDGKSFSYNPKHYIADKSQLRSLIGEFPVGIPVVDLKNAYPNVMDDLQALKASGDIWLLSNFDSQENIAYPNAPPPPPKRSFKVDDELKAHFRAIELPHDMIEIEKELQKNGMKPATDTAKRRALAETQGIPNKSSKPKAKKIRKRTKITNLHLPELFQDLIKN
ncbi:hypothetical protein ACFX13_014156 [Malus domestica]